jgi:hypothetical protein
MPYETYNQCQVPSQQALFSLFPHQVCFPFIADFLPPIWILWILGLPENWSSHVHIRGKVDFIHNKGFSLLLTIITSISSSLTAPLPLALAKPFP